MARQSGLITLRGKLDDKVFVKGRKGRYYVRTAVSSGSKKGETALRIQNIRTKTLNDLAGKLNKLLGSYYGAIKSSDFYVRTQKLFRAEPLDHWGLLLRQLKNLEFSPSHSLLNLGATRVSSSIEKNKLVVVLHTDEHPYARYEANCFFHEVSLITWSEEGGQPAIQQQFSEWIKIDKRKSKPSFEFSFPTKGARYWLLCQRQSTGINNTELKYLSSQGAAIIDVGCFNAVEQKFIDKTLEERRLLMLRSKKKKEPVVEVARVKPMKG